ncbi:hypothetical protein NHX12_019488 [Muraenolepis orangiensis]|uniref:Uncharacterized protein n=1 Tax=Muraenolepis orangiensis TaxID=630683 RepID=A0A9Q0EVG5_9TELE|nr:hypothetical protein NHX12_019488 [Muraenolepis orangiensis]
MCLGPQGVPRRAGTAPWLRLAPSDTGTDPSEAPQPSVTSLNAGERVLLLDGGVRSVGRRQTCPYPQPWCRQREASSGPNKGHARKVSEVGGAGGGGKGGWFEERGICEVSSPQGISLSARAQSKTCSGKKGPPQAPLQAPPQAPPQAFPQAPPQAPLQAPPQAPPQALPQALHKPLHKPLLKPRYKPLLKPLHKPLLKPRYKPLLKPLLKPLHKPLHKPLLKGPP